MTGGRRLSAAEEAQFVNGLRDEQSFLSRLHVGQIDTVDAKHGIMHVAVPALHTMYALAVPLTVSVDNFGSAWDRHMPMRGDFVLLGFGADNEPHLITMTSWGDDPQVVGATGGAAPPRRLGYARLAQLAASGEAGLDEFIELKGGEWDKRSSGGAYMHGSAQGVLTLAAGANDLKVDKQRDEVRGQAGLYSLESAKTFVHVGDVKRVLTPGGRPTSVVAPGGFNPLLPGKEINLHVGGAAGGLVELPVYDFLAGDVRDSLGVPVVPFAGAPVRTQETVYSLDGLLPRAQHTVDTEGNVQALHPFATVLNLTAPVAAMAAVLGALTVTSTGPVIVDSLTSIALVTPTPASPIVLGGPLAIHPGVHGDVLLVQLTALVGSLTALAGTMTGLEGGPLTPKGAAWTALTTALATVTGLLAQPPGPTGLLSTKVLLE